uniref:Uncharacterized protein n=1 Tax=Globodera rostochiensis TaxID=31243 RepID=A0A914HI88_GLORO
MGFWIATDTDGYEILRTDRYGYENSYPCPRLDQTVFKQKGVHLVMLFTPTLHANCLLLSCFFFFFSLLLKWTETEKPWAKSQRSRRMERQERERERRIGRSWRMYGRVNSIKPSLLISSGRSFEMERIAVLRPIFIPKMHTVPQQNPNLTLKKCAKSFRAVRYLERRKCLRRP